LIVDCESYDRFDAGGAESSGATPSIQIDAAQNDADRLRAADSLFNKGSLAHDPLEPDRGVVNCLALGPDSGASGAVRREMG
jgi:hypothetical protein